MISSTRGIRESSRAFRQHFAGLRPLDLALSPFLVERRLAAFSKRSKLRTQVRAEQGLNVLGRRIWVNKPRFFGGYAWLRRRATVAAFEAV